MKNNFIILLKKLIEEIEVDNERIEQILSMEEEEHDVPKPILKVFKFKYETNNQLKDVYEKTIQEMSEKNVLQN